MGKKKRIILIVFSILILIIILFIAKAVPKFMSKTTVDTSNTSIANENIPQEESISNDKVIIKNSNIQNENLIDEFIENTGINSTQGRTLEILEYTNNNEYVEKSIEFIPGNYATKVAQGLENFTSPNHNSTNEEFKEEYGYYKYFDGKKTDEYTTDSWILDRIIKDNKVEFCINAGPLVELADNSIIPVICSYSVESSKYRQKFDMNYYQRKDMGIDRIYQDKDSVYLLGGDVDITIENDMVYNLQEALEKKILKTEDIIEQAKIDEKYGVCEENGTEELKEYYYSDYTILITRPYEENENIVIGYNGSIKYQVAEELNIKEKE